MSWQSLFENQQEGRNLLRVASLNSRAIAKDKASRAKPVSNGRRHRPTTLPGHFVAGQLAVTVKLRQKGAPSDLRGQAGCEWWQPEFSAIQIVLNQRSGLLPDSTRPAQDQDGTGKE
jgi:hypothetical protein